MRSLLLLALCSMSVACGQRPHVTGITTNLLGLVKTRLGPSSADLAATAVDGRSDRRAQMLGDPTPERLIRLPLSNTIEVRNAGNVRVAAVTLPLHITDFDTLVALDGSARLVVSTYPNARQGTTFTVFDHRLREVTQWEELPATSRFAAASWRGDPAVVYLQEDSLVVRALGGQRLTRLSAPGGKAFREVYLAGIGGDRMVLVASGSGYTPFHMVAVYDGNGLVFHEVGDEHAFALSSVADGFVVSTRSTRWEYRVPDV